MESFIYFLFGLIASVIINLATPYWQRILEGRFVVNKSKKIKALQEELNYIAELDKNPNKFSAVVFNDALALTGLITFLIMTMALAMYAQTLSLHVLSFGSYNFFGKIATSREQLAELSNNLQAASQVIFLMDFLAVILIATITINSSIKIRKVGQFDKYKSEMQKQIAHLQQASTKPNITE